MKIVVSIFSDPAWSLPVSQGERLRLLFPHHDVVTASSREARLRELPDADVLFLSQLKPDEFLLASRVKWIQSPAAGVASLMFPELRASPVVLTNARGIHGEAMAEHVIGLVIVLFRRIHHAIGRQLARTWVKDSIGTFRTLRGRRMGVVGLGAIGSAIADKAAAMGMEVVAVRRHPDAPRPSSVSAVYPPSGLDEVLAMSDVVVLAAPLTGDTRGLIGTAQLARMKSDAILVNVARGKLVCEAGLVNALSSGTIGGAALDVFEHEPLDQASPLWDLPNVVITPHTSAFRSDYWTLAVDLFAENLRRFERGEALVNVVDKESGY
ncbi:MAG TPA: D-2-hydroxyacid dehydrogenase [Vicinamibacterales bacterium]